MEAKPGGKWSCTLDLEISKKRSAFLFRKTFIIPVRDMWCGEIE